MTIQSVVTEIQFPSFKPANIAMFKTTTEDSVKRTKPIYMFFGSLAPEQFWILNRLSVKFLVLLEYNIRLRGKTLGADMVIGSWVLMSSNDLSMLQLVRFDK